MSYQFKGLDHDFNEFKMSYFRAALNKTIYNCYRHACDQVLDFVCSTSLFNGAMSGGSTRRKDRLRGFHKVCSHFIP